MTPFEPISDPLAMPVGALAAHDDPVQAGTSIRAAARAMNDAGLHAIMIAQGRRLVGVLDESALINALAQGLDPNSPVDTIMDRDPVLIQPHMTGAEALRAFNSTGRNAIAVVDVVGNTVGVLTPSRLFHPQRLPYKPQIVGGLATPFGVYLTNGVVSGGAKGMALVSAGAALFLVFFVAILIVTGATRLFSLDVSQGWLDFASTLLFLVGLRAIPIAGTHAAEHMVVHAIERGEELTLDVVRRMPRVHPRCGTNIAVGAMIFLGLFSLNWGDESLRLLVALIATMFLWKPMGALAQFVFTTKPPTDAQVMSGIKAGKELLAASASSRRAVIGPFNRFLASGILHVMLGASLTQFLVMGVLMLLDPQGTWGVLFMLV